MKPYKYLILLSLMPILSFAANSPYSCQVEQTTEVSPGLTYQKLYCDVDGNKDVVVNTLKADLSEYKLSPVVTSLNQDKKFQNVMNIAESSPEKNNILAGVNGGFFDMATTEKPVDNICNDLGPNMEFKSYPQYGTGDSTLVINGETFGNTCQGPRPVLAFSNNDSNPDYDFINVNFKEQIPANYQNAMGAGPLLVENGNELTSFPGNFPWIDAYASRTAIGFNQQKTEVYLVAVDSKNTSTNSMGMTIPQLANFMKYNLDTYSAMNLDGGGSTTMCIGSGCQQLVNTPGDPGSVPRLVYDGLYIEKK